MNPWKLTYSTFVSEEENLREALCTLGNGYFGTRGAAPETEAGRVHYPGTYIAGVYNVLPTEVAGRTISNEDFVNCPNWLVLNYRIENGPWFDRQKVKILSWKIELNMRKGMLSRRVRWQDGQGRITVVENHRIVSMSNPHYGALRCTIRPENYSGKLTIRSGIDGLIINAGVERYKQLSSKHLDPCQLGTFGRDGIFLQTQTNQSRIQITEALRTIVYRDGQKVHPKMEIITYGRARIIQEFTLDVKKGQRYSIEKLVSIYTSRDQGVTDNCAAAQETIGHIPNFDALFQPHQAKWKALWKRFDIEVEGDEFVQFALRFHAFHLLQSASTYNDDIDAGMPVRGLHGEAYRGHIFWDGLFVFPFYTLRAPEITRALLMYRYRRLGAAKENAKKNGYRGAMYPWQSASTGEETSQVVHLNPMSGTWGPDYSSNQRHVNIAIAYSVWTYFYASGDRDFLERYGAEIMIEIAHFWSSMARFNPSAGRFEIEWVMGPDEFHEKYPDSEKGGLRNNAYTNVMAVWVLKKALLILDQFFSPEDRAALLIKANIHEEEITQWREMTRKMTVPRDQDGLIHQFEGYRDLEELNWDEYRRKYANIQRIDRILKAEGLSPDCYKVSKQADVLMLFYVLNFDELKKIFEDLGYPFDKNIAKRNFDYYLPRTSHGSTLSMVVHALVAERLGARKKMFDFFAEALKSDVCDIQGGTTQEGIHAGVMGGSLDVFLKIFGGLSIREDRLCLNPNVPKQWKRVAFQVRYKNVWFHVVVKGTRLTVTAEPLQDMSLQPSTEIPIEVKKKSRVLRPGRPQTFSI